MIDIVQCGSQIPLSAYSSYGTCALSPSVTPPVCREPKLPFSSLALIMQRVSSCKSSLDG